MPFIMLCGLPSSGKTYYCNKLVEYLTTLEKQTHVINDAMYCNDKNADYLDSTKEKLLRANLKSQVQQLMSKEKVVILDSSNYIKGYRYELFCILKLAQTTQSVIFANTPFEQCISFNEKRPQDERYTTEVMTALNMRFEPPESKNRWDSTLFTMTPGQELPYEEISNVLFSQKAPPPNKSTLNKPLSDTNFLHDIDKTTQEIINFILNLQSNQLAGTEIQVPGATEKVTFSNDLIFLVFSLFNESYDSI
jgi:protein KTI12